MKIILIAALGAERQLGLNNELLWQLPGDLPRFKELTMGKPIIMGRKTYDSIGRPLPGRQNIIISRDKGLKIDGIQVANSTEQAIELASTTGIDSVFVIGGGEIYTLFLEMADALELTEVQDSPQADAFFPNYDDSFVEISRIRNETKELIYDYVRYERDTKH